MNDYGMTLLFTNVINTFRIKLEIAFRRSIQLTMQFNLYRCVKK